MALGCNHRATMDDILTVFGEITKLLSRFRAWRMLVWHKENRWGYSDNYL